MDSSSDENDSSSDEKDKKHAAKRTNVIVTAIIWTVKRARTASLLMQLTKKREQRSWEARSKNACKAMVLVSIASVWPEQNAKVGKAI